MKNILLASTMAIMAINMLGCVFFNKAQKPVFCNSSDINIDADKWIAVAKHNFEKDYESYNDIDKKYFKPVYNSIQSELGYMNENYFFHNLVHEYMKSPFEFDEFQKICIVLYSYHGEVGQSIWAILWKRRYKDLGGMYIDNNNVRSFVNDAS
jgi:hypothetical protein